MQLLTQDGLVVIFCLSSFTLGAFVMFLLNKRYNAINLLAVFLFQLENQIEALKCGRTMKLELYKAITKDLISMLVTSSNGISNDLLATKALGYLDEETTKQLGDIAFMLAKTTTFGFRFYRLNKIMQIHIGVKNGKIQKKTH